MNYTSLHKKIVNAVNYCPDEERAVLRFLKSLQLEKGHRILDVGCGYGKKTLFLRGHGYCVEGIDINLEIVQQSRAAGLPCRTPDELRDDEPPFDVILMLHVVEHFSPSDLLPFIDSYLDRLKPAGHLVIATPLACQAFYQDFDHIKPYHPVGMKMVFGSGAMQVQYYARNRLELKNLWFRRSPLALAHFPGIYLPNRAQWPVIVNLLLTILFRLSFGLLGRASGWVGLYRKTAIPG